MDLLSNRRTVHLYREPFWRKRWFGRTLVVVALQQPLAGVVFVLDGVLLGAGDATYLAWAQAAALVAFAPAAWWVLHSHGTVTQLWLALTVFMLVRAAAFLGRIRTGAWLVTGASR